MEEIWKSIEGFESYQVSNMGNVKSLPRTTTKGGLLKLKMEKNNYMRVCLFKDKKKHYKLVHRLVLQAFNPTEEKLDVDHEDNNKSNNCLYNLRWCSDSENNMNKPKRQGCSSKYKGVTWDKWNNKWKTTCQHNHIGLFDDEEEAGRAYDAYIIQHLADFGILNFPV